MTEGKVEQMNKATCNICGERLHMGCCNPGRPAGIPAGQPSDHIQHLLPPIALTDQHVAALERTIRAEGYTVLHNVSTGEIALKRTPVPGWDDIPDNPWPKMERMERVLRGLRYAAQVNQRQDGLAVSWAEVEAICKEGLGE